MKTFLKTIDFFSQLADDDIQKIENVSHVETYQSDRIIFEEGWDADRLFILKKGCVRISKHIEGVGEEVLAIIREGDYFGEMALIDDHRRSARATAMEDLEVVIINKTDFDQLMQDNLKLANRLLWTFSRILSKRLRDLHEKLESMFAMTRFY